MDDVYHKSHRVSSKLDLSFFNEKFVETIKIPWFAIRFVQENSLYMLQSFARLYDHFNVGHYTLSDHCTHGLSCLGLLFA